MSDRTGINAVRSERALELLEKGLDYDQIAERMSTSLRRAHSLVHSARKRRDEKRELAS